MINLISPDPVAKVWEGIGVITKTPCKDSRKLEDVSFLSSHFHWCNERKKYFPKPEYDKVMCSLLYASATQDIRWHYLRACALRIESYWNIEARHIISGYICDLEQNYQEFLSGEIKGLKWEHIRALFMSDVDIENLYDGKESSALSSRYSVLKHLDLINRN